MEQRNKNMLEDLYLLENKGCLWNPTIANKHAASANEHAAVQINTRPCK